MPEPTTRRRRVTISEIAERTRVSKSAVSYALNDRPGVSDATRERILTVAEELGWYPNYAARSLSAARANACGLVLARPARTLAVEPFFMEFIVGVESELSPHSTALTIQLADDVASELMIFRRWWAERRVDGVLVVDLRLDDPRIDELVELGLPAVVVGGPTPGGALPSAWHDEVPAVTEIVRYLGALGHRRIAWVAGVAGFQHTATRTTAFREAVRELSLQSTLVSTDYTPESGAGATRQLLSDPDPPTAIVYDSEVLAVTGLGVAQQMGFAVPADLSIVAWDDSLLCQVVHPPLTSVTRDIVAYGAAASRHLLAEIADQGQGDVQTPRGKLTPRGSTGRAPSASTRRRSRSGAGSPSVPG
ncbi:MAG: LacI family DNA-binding transcriptional regulator [Gaiellaceae bacterium]